MIRSSGLAVAAAGVGLALVWGQLAQAADYGGLGAHTSDNGRYAAEIDVFAAWLIRTGEGINESGGTSEDPSLPIVGAAGKVAMPLSSGHLLQFDLDAEKAFANGSDDNYAGSVVGGVHLAGRSAGGWMWGGFAALGRTQDLDPEQSATIWALGIEALGQVGAVDVLGQVGYMDASAVNPEGLHEAVFGRAVARKWVNPETRLSGELAVASGMQDTDNTLLLFALGGEVERSLNLMPSPHATSGYLRYDGVLFNEGGADATRIVDHRFTLGLRMRFGGPPTGEGTPYDLPNFGHWYGGGPALD